MTGLLEVRPELLAFADDGLCMSADQDEFFAPDGRNATPARRICARCPVVDQCREYGLRFERYGTWGGLTEMERVRWRVENGWRLPDEI